MPVLALDDITFKLDGDNIRIKAISGDTTVKLIVSARKARAYHARMGQLFDEHAAKCAEVVPIKRKRAKH